MINYFTLFLSFSISLSLGVLFYYLIKHNKLLRLFNRSNSDLLIPEREFARSLEQIRELPLEHKIRILQALTDSQLNVSLTVTSRKVFIENCQVSGIDADSFFSQNKAVR